MKEEKELFRMPAEWELQQFVMMSIQSNSWYGLAVKKNLINIANIISQFQKVIILTEQPELIYETNRENILCIPVKTNDLWIRDYGFISTINLENNKLCLSDFTFNGWGLKHISNYDNQANENMYACYPWDTPQPEYKRIKFILEGGSIDSNGTGELLTTKMCLLSKNRNEPITQKQVDDILKIELGIKKTHWLSGVELLGDDTDGHIDNIARFVSYGSIVFLACDDITHPMYTQCRQLKTELEALTDNEGNAFRLIPIQIPTELVISNVNGRVLPASYLNFLVINGAVIVPQYGNEKYPKNHITDRLAMSVLSECFPDRQICPIQCNDLLEGGGSIHCATMGVFCG